MDPHSPLWLQIMKARGSVKQPAKNFSFNDLPLLDTVMMTYGNDLLRAMVIDNTYDITQ